MEKKINKISLPIQYLGAKNRIINKIISLGKECINQGRVLDLFSGSSVVSQAFALDGFKVISNDIQKFSGIISSLYLKVGYKESELMETLDLLFDAEIDDFLFYSQYKNYIEIEENLIKQKGYIDLLDFYETFPLYWNNKDYDEEINKIKFTYTQNIGNSAIDKVPLFSMLYAGTYFGIKQSLCIDFYRYRIEELKNQKSISNWLYNLLMGSLLKVVSQTVNSAGKHFAQPIQAKNIKNNKLLQQRLINNRSIEINKLLKEVIIDNFRIISISKVGVENEVLTNSMEDILNQDIIIPNVDLIYADPPYTAQQYSRFYHIPEILASYNIPQLQIIKGKVTSGIYPDNKFKSNFCSKAKAPIAFRNLFQLTRKMNSSLLLSYSQSKSSVTGNQRMISLEQIREIKDIVIPDYEMKVLDLDINYKQLNKQSSIVEGKSDIEVLILFKKIRR